MEGEEAASGSPAPGARTALPLTPSAPIRASVPAFWLAAATAGPRTSGCFRVLRLTFLWLFSGSRFPGVFSSFCFGDMWGVKVFLVLLFRRTAEGNRLCV